MDNPIEEIKKQLQSDKLIIGAEESIKALRNGKLAKAYLAVNTKEQIKEDLKRLAELSEVEVVELSIPNDELGTACKKPYPISVIGILQ